MKNGLFFFIVVFGLGLLSFNCKNSIKKIQSKESAKTAKDLEKERVLRIAEETAFKEYGNIIKKELPLKVNLVGDSLWIIEGTLAKGADGGSVYIELRRGDNKIVKITHYK